MYEISIVTVCLNSAKTIRDTIESLLHQTYQSFEYIIIDGESGDGTLDIIKEYKCILGDRMKLISEKDHGIYDAMNKGIKIASGNIIGILNSDDWYESYTLERIKREFDANKDVDIITGELRFVSSEKKYIKICKNRNIPETILYKMPVNHPATFVRKSVYEEIGNYDLRYRLSSDYDFICRAYIFHKNFKQIDEVLVNMRFGGATSRLRNRTSQDFKSAFILIKEDYLLIKRNMKKNLIVRYWVKFIKLYFCRMIYRLIDNLTSLRNVKL